MNMILNKKVLTELRHAAYNNRGQDLVDEVIQLFFEHADQAKTELESSIRGFNMTKMQRSAHKFRGLCLNVGAEALAALCTEIEKCASVQDAELRMLELQSLLAQTLSALGAFSKSMQAAA